MIIARQKKRLEAEELSEEQQADVRAQIEAQEARIENYLLEGLNEQIQAGRVRVISTLKTDVTSEETQT